MSQRLPPTLSEIRLDLLTRCGLASGGTVPVKSQMLLDSKIRSAERQLYEKHPWLALTVDGTTDLSDGETDYDIPDNTEPAKIRFIGVRRISDQYVFQLDPGFTPEENSAANRVGVKNQPLRYIFINGVIRLAPPPDIRYFDALHLVYQTIPGPMVQDDERTSVEPEALAMFAEILVKEHFGGVDTAGLRADLKDYVNSIKSDQSDGAGFQMGGHQSLVVRTKRRNRFAWSNLSAQQSSQNWHPW